MTAVQFAALLLGTLGIVMVLVVIERRGHRPVQQGREAFGLDDLFVDELIDMGKAIQAARENLPSSSVSSRSHWMAGQRIRGSRPGERPGFYIDRTPGPPSSDGEP